VATEGEREMKRFALLGLAVFAVVAALAAPALGAQPTTVVTVIVDFTYSDSALCGFPIVFVENGSFKVKTYYDSAGNKVKSILTNQGPYGESATANGKTLTANYPSPFITSFTNGTLTLLGLRSAYHVPGAGLVLLDAGRVVFDSTTGDVLSESGQHQRLNGDVGAFCAYFA
jgi:hypothetical protein